MKKYVLLFIMMIGLCIPHFVAADAISVWSDLSGEGTVKKGSIITYQVSGYALYNTNGNHSDLNGTITYDSTQLKVNKIYVETSSCYYDECGDSNNTTTTNTKLNITKNTAGTIKYTLTTDAKTIINAKVYVLFEIKSMPSEDNIKVRFIPDDKTVLDGESYLEEELFIEENGDESDGSEDDNYDDGYEEDVNDETFEEPEENDEVVNDDATDEDGKKTTTNTNDKKDEKDNTFLYLSIVSIMLNVVLIVLLIVKSKKNKPNELM